MNAGKSIRMAMLINDMKDQKELAKEIDISENTLTSIISGGPCKMKTMDKIADLFDMKLSELIALGE